MHYTGEYGKYGIESNVGGGMRVVKKDVGWRFSFLGIEGGGSAGVAGGTIDGGLHATLYYDTETGKVHMIGSQHFGFGFGEALGGDLAVPVPNWAMEMFK